MNANINISGVENTVGLVPVGGAGRTLLVVGPGGIEATIALGAGDSVLLAKPVNATDRPVRATEPKPDAVPLETATVPKRRGRPPKVAQPVEGAQETEPATVPKRRGRPPKVAQDVQAKPAKRGPGRPRKAEQPEEPKPNGAGGNGVDTETGEITITDEMFLDALDVALGDDDVPVSTAQMADALNAPLALVRAKARELSEAGAIVASRVNRENRYTFPSDSS